MGEMFWKVDTSVMHSITDGAECLRMMGSSPVTNLGWPADVGSALNLPSGATYRLSYKVSSTGPLVITLQPKVGMAVTPYTADFPVGGAVSDPVGTTAQTFTHMFTVQTADTKAGLALSVAAAAGMTSQMSTVCFDDVSLVRQ